MECPRCGASGFDGVCNYCGFPVTRMRRNMKYRTNWGIIQIRKMLW